MPLTHNPSQGLAGASPCTAFHSETGPKGSFCHLAFDISQSEGQGHVAVDRVHDGASETHRPALPVAPTGTPQGLGMVGTVEPSWGV